ncbi:DNA ligase [Halochromatium salexigens]|uniref:DNA ligase n=1 Tax=Halochromatium salexigens TaxID=49447 RepID=A0AAJ0UFX2_HALSE|nr:DNA ligase [Halochromatium salexigens]MBK5930717.1 DNA ligase [Halochromatium salexigens]
MPQAPLPRLGLPLLLWASLRTPFVGASHAGSGLDTIDPSTATDLETEHQDLSTAVRAAPPELTLAQVYEPGVDLTQYLVSEKFDGVRAFWDGRRLITRGGLIINAPAWFTAGFPNQPLDGELWMGRGTFADLSGTVRTLEPEVEAWQQVRYVLFDLPAAEGGFEARFTALEQLLEQAPSTRLRLAHQHPIADHEALQARLERIVAAGGEGLMLHRRDAPYQGGRSATLLKVKPYLEGEAIVLEHLPGQGKYTGMLGSMLVEEPDGTRFKLGTGFSDAERADPPPVGSLVTFKYHGRTKYDRPRFASFLRVADDL